MIWTFHELNVGRLVGSQAAQARPEWAILVRGRSLLGQSPRYLAMMTRLVLTKPFKIWSMIIKTHSRLWYPNFIAIPPFVCLKSACIELLISLHNDQHLFADGFVTVRSIAMKFGWDKENVSRLKYRKYHLNPSNFNRKWMMMFKLYLKKIRLPHLEPRCITG